MSSNIWRAETSSRARAYLRAAKPAFASSVGRHVGHYGHVRIALRARGIPRERNDVIDVIAVEIPNRTNLLGHADPVTPLLSKGEASTCRQCDPRIPLSGTKVVVPHERDHVITMVSIEVPHGKELGTGVTA